MKHPRKHMPSHLNFVRQLPCLVCNDNTSTEAAHIRYADRRAGKRPTGMGEKPDDTFTVPLCSMHHREQHTGNEKQFWRDLDIDPVFVALALHCAAGDHELARNIISEWNGQ